MIKAIDTLYNGNYFRSRLEARWAVFFDAIGIRWEYEAEGYDLGDGLRYLPDFWFPDYKMYGEVKPDRELEEIEKEKIMQLAKKSGFTVVLFSGPPSEKTQRAWSWNMGNAELGYEGYWNAFMEGDIGFIPFGGLNSNGRRIEGTSSFCDTFYPSKLEKQAIEIAQTKRFEHGSR